MKRQSDVRDMKTDKKAGVEAGKAEERKENAKRMKELKMSNEQICQILNITEEELKKLIEE